MQRIDIQLRNNKIIQLFRKGISRKQIPRKLEWEPVMSYEAINKVIQRTRDRRRVPRGTLERRAA